MLCGISSLSDDESVPVARSVPKFRATESIVNSKLSISLLILSFSLCVKDLVDLKHFLCFDLACTGDDTFDMKEEDLFRVFFGVASPSSSTRLDGETVFFVVVFIVARLVT